MLPDKTANREHEYIGCVGLKRNNDMNNAYNVNWIIAAVIVHGSQNYLGLTSPLNRSCPGHILIPPCLQEGQKTNFTVKKE